MDYFVFFPKIFFISIILFLFPWMLIASQVHIEKLSFGYRLMVDSQPYFVKGVCYSPSKVGESFDQGTIRDWTTIDDDGDGQIDAAYQSWVDINKNNQKDPEEVPVGDFKLLQQMGCNTIRIYHHASSHAEVQNILKESMNANYYNHPPNKILLRDLYKTCKIRVAMGDFLGAYCVGSGASWDKGTDYRNPTQCKNMLRSVEDMVQEYKNEPYLLLWIIGNENNYSEWTKTNEDQYPVDYAKFVDKIAQRIHQMDPNHPVSICIGETKMLKILAEYAPHVDIFGVNSYRNPGFGDLWDEVNKIYDRPVLLTEFGVAHPKVENNILDEDDQVQKHLAAWKDIENHAAGKIFPGNSIGGFVYSWLDDWWQDGEPSWQNTNPNGSGWNHEWNGIASQGDGKNSLFLRQLRKIYFSYQSLWTQKFK